MQFDLQHCRPNPGVREQVAQQRSSEIADANLANPPAVHQLLHGFPGLPDRDSVRFHAGRLRIRIEKPPSRVALVERHELHRDRKMDKVEVQVIEPQVPERALESRPDVLVTVVRVP
jgi:hypothetical protein